MASIMKTVKLSTEARTIEANKPRPEFIALYLMANLCRIPQIGDRYRLRCNLKGDNNRTQLLSYFWPESDVSFLLRIFSALFFQLLQSGSPENVEYADIK
ncbi:hypothetical protein ACTXT7_013625 [Hymenolepis weldensis]